MSYFQTLKLGKPWEQYNNEIVQSIINKTENPYQLHQDFKHYLKIFEPKNSKYEGVHDALHIPLSDNGKNYKSYLLQIRELLHQKGIHEIIKVLEIECEEYSKKSYLAENKESIRSKKIDFWSSWYHAVWNIWGNIDGVSQFEEEFLSQTNLHYNELINEYFWDELNLRLFGNTTTHNQLNRSIQPELIQRISEFIDFHFFAFSYEATLFFKNLKVIMKSKNNIPQNLIVKKVLREWIEQREVLVNVTQRKNNINEAKLVENISPKALKICASFKEEMAKPNMNRKDALTNIARKTTEYNGDLTTKKNQIRKQLIKGGLWEKERH